MDNNIKLKEGQVVGGFEIKKRLGEGGCGIVYKVLAANGNSYAMKVEPTTRKKNDQLLPLEAQILKRLQFSPYAVPLIQFSKITDFRILVMGLLGPSLSHLQNEQPGYQFTIGTVLRIGFQGLQAISFLHSVFYVHRDIKPSNFAIDQDNCRRIYLIDFGLARSLKKRGSMKLRKPRKGVPFRGTPAYCSLNAHKQKEHGRHDDLWSLFYMLVDMSTGSLPWFKHSRASTVILKEELIDMEYMHGCPVAFSTILNYLRTLNYYQKPDYAGIEQAFIQMMQTRGVKFDQPIDWEKQPSNLSKKSHKYKKRSHSTRAQMDTGSSNAPSGTLKFTCSLGADSTQ